MGEWCRKKRRVFSTGYNPLPKRRKATIVLCESLLLFWLLSLIRNFPFLSLSQTPTHLSFTWTPSLGVSIIHNVSFIHIIDDLVTVYNKLISCMPFSWYVRYLLERYGLHMKVVVKNHLFGIYNCKCDQPGSCS